MKHIIYAKMAEYCMTKDITAVHIRYAQFYVSIIIFGSLGKN